MIYKDVIDKIHIDVLKKQLAKHLFHHYLIYPRHTEQELTNPIQLKQASAPSEL
jgi:hypothetical protein